MNVEIRKLLQEEMHRAQERNSQYSLRSFARRLNIAPSALSEILRGKRPITYKSAERILGRLCLSPDLSRQLLSQFSHRKGSKEAAGAAEFQMLSLDLFHVIADWHYFAILSLAQTEGFNDDPHWIARRLRIRSTEVSTALERLERLDLLKRDESGVLRPTQINFATPTDIPDASIRKNHSQGLELARRSLEEDNLMERDFQSMTMAIDPEKIPEAKKMIRNFRNRLCRFLESGPKKEVYRLTCQLIPLTKPEQSL